MSHPVKFLPDEKSQEATRLLPYVMAVMVYLSALALMGSLLLHRGFDQWSGSLNNRLTVQITEENADRRDKITQDTIKLLQQTPGIETVHKLEPGEIEQLLEPWLGEGNVTDDLPVPDMLDVTVSRALSLNLDALRSQLNRLSPNIHLDDHQQWLGRFLRLMDMVEYTALGILLLVIMATIAIVIFGTKAGMAEHREIIAIMHHLGTRDSMIARAYQDRFMKYGLKGGIMGLFLAFVTVMGLIYLSRDLASGMVTIPDLPLFEIITLLVVPIVAALISMLTARFTVLRDLGRMV